MTVGKPALVVEGASTADGCTTLTAADPTKDSIVTGGSFGFSLTNNNILLSGFVVQNSAIGIQTSDAFSGYRITDNVAQNDTTAGVNFNSGGGSQSRVDHNCLRSNSGDGGLESEIGNLKNALIDHNTTFQNLNNGIDLSGSGQRAYVTVTNNSSIKDAGSSFTMDNSIGSSIDHNTSQHDPGTTGGPITIGGANNSLNVSYNTVQAGGNGIVFNPNTFFPVFPAPNQGLTVNGNTISQTLGSGIVATPNSVTLSLFSGNAVSLTGIDGIRIQSGNNNNRIENNHSDQNNHDGIRNEVGATGNTYLSNSMFLNVTFDAEDGNRTANTWSGNHCNTDFPPGTICGV